MNKPTNKLLFQETMELLKKLQSLVDETNKIVELIFTKPESTITLEKVSKCSKDMDVFYSEYAIKTSHSGKLSVNPWYSLLSKQSTIGLTIVGKKFELLDQNRYFIMMFILAQ